MNPVILLLFLALDPVAFGPGGRFHLEQSKDDFGTRSHGIIEDLGSGRTKLYALPQSTAQDYFRLRPDDLKRNAFTPEGYDRQEAIGPYQIEEGRIWFGKTFYDSEGMRGVGAFGYFDASARAYTLFSPPEVAACEVSAILVQPKWVWVALDHFIEDISTFPCGLVRWDKTTHQIKSYPLEFVVESIRAEGDSLRLKTRGGYALLRDRVVRRFLDDHRPIAKFPPPPSHY
ncbi:MAG TPA: hypothetical protein VK789_27650 [Bryobacteraceae bacterium]|jgi:hypothetical protein|nr:hypothetical protein [Bryobacteraceae bacterium]